MNQTMTALLLNHLLVVILLTLLNNINVNGDLFPTPQFSGEDVTSKVFGSGDDVTSDIFPIAYGDFNADKHTDIIAVTNNRSSIVLFFAYAEPPFLRVGRQCTILVNHNNSGPQQKVEIIGAAPGDFTGDGVMDLLVTMLHSNRKSVEILIFEGNSSDLICSNQMTQTIDMANEPIVVDLNGDMVMDLVGEQYVNEDCKNYETKRHYWIFSKDPKLHPMKYDFTVYNQNWTMRPLAYPTSNAIVDINKDLDAELILTTTNKRYEKSGYYIETYKMRKNEHDYTVNDGPIMFEGLEEYVYVGSGNERKNTFSVNVIGQPLFLDLNQDGSLLQLLPYCSKSDCSDPISPKLQGLLVIVNNSYVDLPLSSSTYDSLSWGFPNPSAQRCHSTSRRLYYSRSIVLRMGDYNLDGYPDLIAVLEAKPKKYSSEIIRRAVVFENVPCKESPDVKCPFSRTFSLNFKVLNQYTNVTLATFFDIHEDGLIDVLVVRKSDNSTHPNSKTGKFELRAFQNSPDYDSNFIKVMVLTGLKCDTCPQMKIPYGNVIPGPVISYRTKTQAGNLQTAIAAQNYRSANMPMDLPYTIFGIGHSPNFVETLKISLSSDRYHEYFQIIPNSQIIVIPSPLDQPKMWKAKLFLTPSDAVLQTFAVLLGICAVVACIVIGLQIKEVREDRKDRLHEAHRFMM